VFNVTAGPVHDDDGDVIAGMVIGVDVTGVRRLAATQAALHRLARASASRTPAAEVIHDLVATLLELFGAGYVGVTRFAGDAIHFVSTAPPLPGGVGPIVPHDGRSASSLVLATGKPAFLQLDDPDLGRTPLMDAIGARTTAAVPIHVDGRLWGALAVGLPDAPSELDQGLDTLVDFAELVALAISNSEAWDELQQRSTTDPLTGLANRRTFEDRLAAEVERAHRTGSPLSVAIIDLDHFKAVNDRYGHGVGDEVLTEVARCLAAACRSDDLVARLGGEEFAVILPSPAAVAMTGIERLRAAIRAGAYPDGLEVTASAGCASIRDQETDPSQLLRRADVALYRAKADGRDRAVIDAE
jgi:diguanylate cyclase (GGDEF)-like protein